MSINDMLDAGITIQGNVLVKETDKYFCSHMLFNDNAEWLDRSNEWMDWEVTYMYPEDELICIEVKEED